MALSQFHDRDASFYRSRSSSFSSPTSRSILYQEVLTLGDNALVRSFSCGQVFTKNEKGATTYHSSSVRISNFISPIKKAQAKAETPKFWSQPKVKPASGDIKPVKARMALTFAEDDKSEKETHPSRSKLAKNVTKTALKIMKGTVYVNVVVLAILIAAYLPKYRYCNQSWDVEPVIYRMSRSVFGQEKALSKIATALRNFNRFTESSVVAFTGGTGVGKTFVSSMIYDTFPWYSNVYVNYFDSLLEKKLLSNDYLSCAANMIVIDGLNQTVADSAVSSVNKLLRSVNQNKRKLFLLLIFQTLNSEEEIIVRHLDNLQVLSYYYVHFSDLSHSAIKKCFMKEFELQKKAVSNEQLERLVLDQMKLSNVSKSLPNCKKVFHEVSHHSDKS